MYICANILVGNLNINNCFFPVCSFNDTKISLTGIRKIIYFSGSGVWEFSLTEWLINMSYQENNNDFEIVEEELVTGCSQMRGSHLSALLQQGAWRKQKTHSKNQSILVCTVPCFFLFPLHQKQHLLFVLLILLCNKINFQLISNYFFLHQAIFSCCPIVSDVPSTVSDNDTVGWFGGEIKKREKRLICRIVVLANALLICGYREKHNLFKANDEVNMLAWFCVFD